MQKNKMRKYKSFLMVIEVIFTLFYMFLSMTYSTYIRPDLIEKKDGLYLMGTFALLGLTRVFRILGERYRKPIDGKKKLDFVTGAAFFTCSLVLLFNLPAVWAHQLACIVYLLSLLGGMILSIIKNRSLSNILLKLILSVGIIFFTIDLWSPKWAWSGRAQVMTLASFIALLTIISVAFLRVRMELLKNIIKETYALEIMFGLLVLILSLSYWLSLSEPGMSYTDALWYCFAIVTTIGFGDIAATTQIGRIISVLLGAYGIIVVALITSIIVNYYGEMKKNRQSKNGSSGDPQSDLTSDQNMHALDRSTLTMDQNMINSDQETLTSDQNTEL